VGVNRTLVEAKMFTITLEYPHFIFNKQRYRLCGVASLMMYSSEASQRIVKKSLYRTAPPFSIYSMSKSVPLRPTTMQMPNLALVETKRITVWYDATVSFF
jgi:hypothetical protein